MLYGAYHIHYTYYTIYCACVGVFVRGRTGGRKNNTYVIHIIYIISIIHSICLLLVVVDCVWVVWLCVCAFVCNIKEINRTDYVIHMTIYKYCVYLFRSLRYIMGGERSVPNTRHSALPNTVKLEVSFKMVCCIKPIRFLSKT